MKYILILTVVLTAVEVHSIPLHRSDTSHGSDWRLGSDTSHHLFLGKREDDDRLLYYGQEKMGPSGIEIRSKVFEWPHLGCYSEEKITRIEMYDKNDNGRGGHAHLLEGGVGDRTIRILLTTQKGGSFNYKIKIFGK